MTTPDPQAAELVEQVARAICDSYHQNDPRWPSLPTKIREHWNVYARAAIAGIERLTRTPEPSLREALCGYEGIESGPNGRGGMSVVVHFTAPGNERALFHLLNELAALSASPAEPEVSEGDCPPHCCCCDHYQPCCDCGEIMPSKACIGEKCWCGAAASKKVGEEILFDDSDPARHNLTAYVCARHYAQLMGPLGAQQVGIYTALRSAAARGDG